MFYSKSRKRFKQLLLYNAGSEVFLFLSNLIFRNFFKKLEQKFVFNATILRLVTEGFQIHVIKSKSFVAVYQFLKI